MRASGQPRPRRAPPWYSHAPFAIMRGDKSTAPIGAGSSVRDVFIAGAGQTPVTKDQSGRGRYLGASAVQAALADAGIASAAVGGLFVGNMLSGILSNQQQLGGLLADYSGLAG